MKLGDNFTGSYCFWESRFTLRLNSAKNTDHIKKRFKQKLCQIKFPMNNSVEELFLSPSRIGARGLQTLPFFKYNVLKWETRFTLGLNAAKSTDYNKTYFKQKLFGIKFPTKNSLDAYPCLLQEWS